DDAVGEIAILNFPPPVSVDGEHLDVDAFAVDEVDAIGAQRTPAALTLERRPLHHIGHTVDRAVCVHIDDGDALAGDRDFLPLDRPRRGRAGAAAAPAATTALRQRWQSAA